MCLRRAPEKNIAGAALDRAALRSHLSIESALGMDEDLVCVELYMAIWNRGLQPEVHENTLGVKQRHLTSSKRKHLNRLNLEPTLILSFTKIHSRLEKLACQKQAQSSY
jgi:hypothetical protein